MRIDAHQHFWELRRGDYAWLTPELTPLFRDFLPSDLAPHLADAGIDATVLVQAAATEAETHFLLDIAQSTRFVAGVVGWLDLGRSDFADRAASLSATGGGYLKGIRPMIQDIAGDAWVAAPTLDAAFNTLADLGLVFDALVRPRHLPYLAARLRRSPRLRVVIDHAAKPDIAGGSYDSWRAALEPFSRTTGVMCKLSGLLTEATPGCPTADIDRYARSVLDMFGPERVIWGSDWPVVNLTSDYESWFSMTLDALAHLGASDRDLILGGNACHFYSIRNGATH